MAGLSKPREAALKALVATFKDGAYLNIALRSILADVEDPRDCALATTLAFGVTKNLLYIDNIIANLSSVKLKKLSVWIHNILRIGVYSIKFLDRIPESATVNECVKLSRRYGHGASAGFVNAVKMIFVGAFAPEAIMGGALGVTVQKAMRYGVARGLFSNEAGMGSTPHAHATAEVAHPSDQGLVAMMGVFIDTFIILNMTAFVILSTGVLGNGETGAVLAQSAFNAGLGSFGPMFIAFCMLFFAFTTIVGWYYFGEVNVRALFGEKAVKVYAVIVVLCVAVGSALKVDLVWNMSDMFNGLMVLPNLIALLPCVGIVKKLTKEYEK